MSVRWRSTKDIYDPHFGLKQELTVAYTAAISEIELPIGIAGSDETTDLAVLAPVTTFRMPYAMTLTAVRASVTTAPTDASIVIDINQGGTTVLNGKLTIAATDKTSEDSSGAETLATGTVTLTGGASGSVDGILVDGVEVMSGAESFDTSLGQTATNVAANITANTSSPNYTAAAVGAIVTITAIAGTGSDPNTFTVVSSTTTITTTDVAMSGGVHAQYTIATSALTDNAEITVDVDQVGSTIAGTGLKIWLIGTKT